MNRLNIRILNTAAGPFYIQRLKKLNEFYKKGSLDIKHLSSVDAQTGDQKPFELTTNEFVVLLSIENTKHSALGRFDGKQLVVLRHIDERPFGVKARNVGQKFMLGITHDELRGCPSCDH